MLAEVQTKRRQAARLRRKAEELEEQAFELMSAEQLKLVDRAGGRINKKQAIKLIDGISSYTSLNRYIEKFGPAGYLDFGADGLIEGSEVLRFNRDKKSGKAWRELRKVNN